MRRRLGWPGLAMIAAAWSCAAYAQARFRPEMLVTFPQGTIICGSLEALEKFLHHAGRGERTKVEAMSAAKGGPCTALEGSKERLRVLSVEPLAEPAGWVALEVIPASVDRADGVWTVSVKAKAVRK